MARETAEPKRGGAWLVAGLGMALVAAVFAFLLLYEERPADGLAGVDRLWAFVVETLSGHALGGFLAGAALSFGFGRGGIGGWLLALVVGVLATLVAGALGGTIATMTESFSTGRSVAGDRLVGAAAGALVVPMSVAGSPFLILLWLALVGGVHAAARAVRQGG